MYMKSRPEHPHRREVREATAMEIADVRFLGKTHDIFSDESLHYVTICLLCDWAPNEPLVLEPDKCARWA